MFIRTRKQRAPVLWALGVLMIPEYWINFLDKNEMRWVSCKIPPEEDLANIDEEGPDLYIFNEESSIQESTENYPGIGVKPDGYIPVAGCELGSGDPYFINVNDGENGPLYCIFHDNVIDENYDRFKAIVKILENYQDLVKYKVS